MKRLGVVLITMVLVWAHTASAQTSADSTAVREAALDYVEGWYEGSAERMERALHPDLAKRIVRTTESGSSELRAMDAETLIAAAGRGGGRETPPEEMIKDVRILDMFENVASVRAEMSGWIDYMHLARWNGEWRIVNVLWELKPR